MNSNPVNITMESGLAAIAAKKVELEEYMQTFGEEALKQEFSDLFASHPELRIMSFTAYTPYFMDGVPCIYSVSEIHYLTDDDDDDLINESHWEWNEAGHKEYVDDTDKPKVLKKYYDYNTGQWTEEMVYPKKALPLEGVHEAVSEINQKIQSCEQLIYFIFGDHKIVTVTKEEVKVEDYDHD